MANKKISQLTAKGTALAATDLVEISEDAGGGTYTTKSVTGANVKSGLQPTLVSATNIKTINSTTLLGSGDLAVQATLVSGTDIITINSATLLTSGNLNLQTPLVSATNIKTINSNTILGSGDLVIAGGQKVPAVSNTIGTTITGLTNAISDSFLLPANTFSSNCQIELQWYPSRIVGTSGTTQGLVYINSTNSLTGATLVATGINLSNSGVSNVTCRRTIHVRSNIGTLMSTTNQASSDFSTTQPTENLPFDNSVGIYFLFVMNNTTNVLLQSRNVGYRLVGYNL